MKKYESFSDVLRHPFVVVFAAIVIVAMGYKFGQYLWVKFN